MGENLQETEYDWDGNSQIWQEIGEKKIQEL
jgi:hypothetical protein